MKEADSKITMDQFVKRICGKVESILTDESLVKDFEEIAIEAKGKLEKFENGRLRGQNFRVTDIVNPMQAYFDIKGPSLDNPPELKYKFAYGKFMENKVFQVVSCSPHLSLLRVLKCLMYLETFVPACFTSSKYLSSFFILSLTYFSRISAHLLLF